MNRDLAWGIFAALLIVAIAAFALVWLTPPTLAAGLACRGTVGIASWYGPESGHRTANGERFPTGEATAASRTLPFDTRVRVTDLGTGRAVTVRINDRGPYVAGRIIDLSPAARRALGMGGLARVCVDRIDG